MDDLSYKPILFAVLALSGIAAFFMTRDRARSGFLLFIATLGLGFRTLPLTNDLRIHPAEIALVLVLLLSLASRLTARPGMTAPLLPWWLWVMLPFMFLGWLPSDQNPFPWDIRLAECVNVALVFPVFLATRAVMAKKEAWRPVVLTFYIVGTAVALLGLLEYVFPGIKHVLPGFVTNTKGIEAEGGFRRAIFSFYGNSLAVFLCILALPLGLAIWQWWPKPGPRVVVAAAALVQLGGIYISGFRSIWLLTALLAALFALNKRWFLLLGLLTLLVLGGFLTLPQTIQGRLETLGKIGEGARIDSSGAKRLERIKEAFQSALQNPFGCGWGSAGWVHSDFLQVAANLGMVAGLALLVGYFHTLVRLATRLRSPSLTEELGALGFPLFLSFMVVGQMLAIQGVEFHSFTILPTWLTWAMVETWLGQTSGVPGPAATNACGFQRYRRIEPLLWGASLAPAPPERNR